MTAAEPAWLGGRVPALRAEAHYGDRVVPCWAERPENLYGLLEAQNALRPDGEALVCGAERLTWAALAERVATFAGGLSARGVGAGDRVGMLLGNHVAFVVALFAVARLGAVSVPMGIRQQAPEIAFVLADCGAVALVHDGDLSDRLPDPADVPAVRLRIAVPEAPGAEPFAAVAGAAPPVVPRAEEEPAVILYTSGTTGRPKGAVLTGLGIVHSALVYGHCLGLGPADRGVAAVPLSHVTGLVAGIAAMAACGGTLIVMPAFKAPLFLDLAARERMTFTLMVPAMYALCLLEPDLPARDLSAWRVGGYGGAPMPPATIAALAERLPGLRLANCYGATETTSPATILPPADVGLRSDSVGRACPGTTLLVMDDAGRAVPPGEAGEIWIHGPSVVPRYWANEAATRANLTGGCWRSGDIGTLDPDGYLRVLDRKKDMLNRGGYKVYTAEVEAALASHPDVVESAVIGRPCPVLRERVHAVVVLRAFGTDPESLRGHCAARLADYKVPETFRLDTRPLPRNANGKVLKQRLRAES